MRLSVLTVIGAHFVLITFQLRKAARDATSWLRRMQLRPDGRRIRRNLAAQAAFL
jgi:hypothetical protein